MSKRTKGVDKQEKGNRPKIRLASKSRHVDYFIPMLESFSAHDDLNEVIKNRVTKACDILDAGYPLFPNDFRKEHSIQWVLDEYGNKNEEELSERPQVFAIAGRIVSMRSFGKVLFFHIMDQTGRIQCYASKDHLGEECYKIVRKLEVGDIVGVSGGLFRTKTGRN